MKLADVACQCGCGRVVVQPRNGGPRKRFFEGACRARWARRGKTDKTLEPAKVPSVDDRQATLESIYEQLKSDIQDRGAMIDGRVNPAVEALRKIIVELDRRFVPESQVDDDEITDLIAV